MHSQRNRTKLIISAITLSGVLIGGALLERQRRPPDEQRGRMAEPSSPIFGGPPPVQHDERPSATGASPAPRRASAASEADVRRFLERWRRTLETGNVEAHVALYAPVVQRYFRERNVSRARVEKDKRRFLQLWPSVERYSISDVEVGEPLAGGLVPVEFRKEWDFRSANRRFEGAERQRLLLQRTRGGWQIAGEQELVVYRARRQ